MSDPSKPASEQLLATGGGNATAGGVTFQAEVGALFAVHLIAEQRLSPRLELGDVRARSLRFETEAPVDDILIETDAGGWVFVLAGVAPGAVGVDFGRRSASKPVLGPAVGRTRGSARSLPLAFGADCGRSDARGLTGQIDPISGHSLSPRSGEKRTAIFFGGVERGGILLLFVPLALGEPGIFGPSATA